MTIKQRFKKALFNFFKDEIIDCYPRVMNSSIKAPQIKGVCAIVSIDHDEFINTCRDCGAKLKKTDCIYDADLNSTVKNIFENGCIIYDYYLPCKCNNNFLIYVFNLAKSTIFNIFVQVR